MAQKAFIWINDGPEIVSGNFRIVVQISFLDNSNEDNFHDGNGHSVDLPLNLLTSVRTELRDLAKDLASSLHGWTLGNDDVYLPDWSRELL